MDLLESEPKRIGHNSCACCGCNYSYEYGPPKDEPCVLHDRAKDHTETVYKLKEVGKEERVTLLIGRSEVKKRCYRAVLGLVSEFFYACFYGSFMEARTGIVKLPEDCVESITTFVHWAENGQVYSTMTLYELWAVGKRLQSEAFCNSVMYHNFGIHAYHDLDAQDASAAYTLTQPGSKLRAYVKQQILTSGPLKGYEAHLKRAEKWKASPYDVQKYQEWERVISEGGDLVEDIVLAGKNQFYGDVGGKYHKRPHYWTNHEEFLEPVKARSVEEFAEKGTA